MNKRRNPLGNLPILGKGGAHVVTNTTKRASGKRSLGYELDYWYEENEERYNERLDGRAIEPFLAGRRDLVTFINRSAPNMFGTQS